MAVYKRCPVVFNLANPMQKELYDWCLEESTNFSDFVRTVLYAHRESKQAQYTAQSQQVYIPRPQQQRPVNPQSSVRPNPPEVEGRAISTSSVGKTSASTVKAKIGNNVIKPTNSSDKDAMAGLL